MPLEFSGALIEMNTHMYPSQAARYLLISGGILVFASIMSLLIFWDKKNTSLIIALAITFVIGIGMIFYGDSLPRDKVIMACANGPVSIENVADTYDILLIDGKMMKLRVR